MSSLNTDPLIPRPGEKTLRGVLERIIYYNDENNYCIGELKPDSKSPAITITGTLPQVQCGETLELLGQWVSHPVHGDQFKSREFRATLPSSTYGIRKYLGSGLVPGVGKTYAEKIVNHFGADTLSIIDENSGRLKEVPGIGQKRASQIKKAWDSQRSLRDVMVFLQTYGVSVSQCLRIVREYGTLAINVLKTDPYQVAREIDRIGFKTADRIAINLGFANDSKERLQAGILHAAQTLESEGHTGYSFDQLQAYSAELLEADAERIANFIRQLQDNKSLQQSPGSDLLQLPVAEFAERTSATALLRVHQAGSTLPAIKKESAVQWAQKKAGFTFAPEQSEALRTALNSKISILTGGPGTGKTTILRALVEILSAKKVNLILAAPTGRASQRMSQAARHPASTIHRLLRFDPAAGHFTTNETNPLKTDFVIIDEASMLDNRLANALFRAIPGHAHILLVGDVFQLPSVGCGNVLSDLITSSIFPVTRLQQIFRQGRGSRIVDIAHGILAGQAQAPYLSSDPSEIEPKYDFHFINKATPEDCIATVEALCKKWIPQWYPHSDPFMDVQVLAPMHRGVGGIANINLQLQKSLNPQKSSINLGATHFHKGDKVIQTRNNYDHNIYNGDLGRVSHILPDAGTLAVNFDGREIDLERIDLGDLQLAYGITIHKSQGSEFPVVIIPLLKQHFLLLQRNLLYTAITRGRKKVFIVGDPAAFAMAVNNTEATVRQTDLARKIRAEADL